MVLRMSTRSWSISPENSVSKIFIAWHAYKKKSLESIILRSGGKTWLFLWGATPVEHTETF